MLHEEGHRSMAVVFGYELVVIEHQHHLTGQLGEPIISMGSDVSMSLRPVTLIPARTSAPKSSSGAAGCNASTMCLHSLTGSLSCSSRETQAIDKPASPV